MFIRKKIVFSIGHVKVSVGIRVHLFFLHTISSRSTYFSFCIEDQSINQSFILTRYVKELKNSFKIRTCINKIYNNYSYIILFNFKNNSINIYI